MVHLVALITLFSENCIFWSSIIGPVRNLTCSYVFMEKEPLRCNWVSSTYPHDILPSYTIKVKYNDHTLHSGFTIGTSYKAKPDFIVHPECTYEIIVSELNKTGGTPVLTTLNFSYSGESLLLFISCYLWNPLHNPAITLTCFISSPIKQDQDL